MILRSFALLLHTTTALLLCAQPFLSPELPFGNSLSFEESYIRKHGINAIHVQTLPLAKLRGDTDPGQWERFVFNPQGQLARSLQHAEQDTALVCDYRYSERGLLNWVVRQEKTWNRAYKYSYRFNSDRSIFQVKAFETLQNDVVLLYTLHFVYADGLMQQCQKIENQRVTEINRHAYDAHKRLVLSERTDESGNVHERTAYQYDAAGRILRITQTGLGLRKNEFLYAYGTDQQLATLSWYQEGEPKGVETYTYAPDGKLAVVERQLVDASPKASFRRTFTYE